MTVICFRETEGLHVGNCFLPSFGDLKSGKWDSPALEEWNVELSDSKFEWSTG